MTDHVNANLSHFKLGKGPVVRDPRIPAMARFMKAVPKPPPSADRYSKIKQQKNVPLFKNDTLGDCTCATPSQGIYQWTLYDKGNALAVPDDKVVQLYSETCGFNPNDPQDTDNGGIISNVLAYLAKTGYDIGDGTRHKILSAALNHTDLDEIKDAINIGACVNWGVELPLSAQNVNGVWDVPSQGIHSRQGRPGGWGGHNCLLTGYDSGKKLFYIFTWGMIVPASERFMLAYGVEAYSMWSQDFEFDKAAKTFNGYDWPGLTQALNSLKG